MVSAREKEAATQRPAVLINKLCRELF